jgi:hypothetical protein
MSEVQPACADDIDHQNVGGWQPIAAAHDPPTEPCGYCFPDGEIDVERDQLVISQHGERVHRDAATGEIDYQAVVADEPSRSLRNRLLDLDPEDAGLSPTGGDA